MFTGSYERVLDTSFRFKLPAALAAQLREEQEGNEGALVFVREPECVCIYSMQAFAALLKAVSSAPGSSRDRMAARWLARTAVCTAQDAQNRVVIPAPLRRPYAFVSRGPVMLVGMLDHIELWEHARYVEMERETEKDIQALRAYLAAHYPIVQPPVPEISPEGGDES